MSTLPCAITSDSGSLFAVYQSRQQAEAVMNKILGMFPMHASVPGYLLTEVPDEIALRPIPPKALELLRIARDRGHGVRLLQGEDTGGRVYLTIETSADANGNAVRVTWHTRVAPTYRLFSCLVGSRGKPHDGTLTAAIAQLSSGRGRR